MQLWAGWIDTLSDALSFLATAGLGTGLAIVALTLVLRIVLLPLSWYSAWSNCVHQRKLKLLRPDLDRIRRRFADDPARLSEAIIRLHTNRGVPMLNARPLLGAIVQMPVLLGMFQMLRTAITSARFLWVENLARPDVWLAVLAAATTALLMAANPEMPESTRQLLIWLPSVIAFVFALKFASALAIYWATSNCFAAMQTWAVHRIIEQRISEGKLRI